MKARARTRGRVAIVNYHYCHPADHAFGGLKGVTPEELDGHLQAIRAAGLSIVSLSEVLRMDEDDDTCVALTFDDGLKDVHTYVLPVLRRHGVSATFFVSSLPYTGEELLHVHRVHLLQGTLGAPTFAAVFRETLRDDVGDLLEHEDGDFQGLYPHDTDDVRSLKIDLNYRLPYPVVDRVLRRIVTDVLGDESDVVRGFYLSHEDVRECLAAGLELGLHSHSHRVMARLDEGGQLEEISLCRAYFQDTFGIGSAPFSYPYGVSGTFDDRTVRLITEDADISAGLTLDRRLATLQDIGGRWLIPRFDNRDLFGFDGVLRTDLLPG